MTGNAGLAQSPAEGRQPFTTGLTTATSIGLSPRWVQYSGVSAAACKVAEALADLATMNTRGDRYPTLDREFLAYVAGLGRADKLAPYLKELQEIGFLRIYDGGVNPSTGKRQQRRNKDGRPVQDHFEITLEPPLGYVGPRNLTDIHAQFITDRDAAYRAVEDAGKTPRAGRHTIRRTEVGRLEFPQVGTVPGIRGHIQIDRSLLFEKRKRSIEPVPGGAAVPPATGLDERQVAAVRELVRQLPWAAWAKERDVKFTLTSMDADEVQAAICNAMVTAGITLEQAARIGQTALAEARKAPVVYVTKAFSGAKLVRRVRALLVEPLSETPLPLPTPAAAAAAVEVPPAAPEIAPAELPACEVCEARAGEPRNIRTVTGEDGRERPCSVCLPTVA